MIIHEIYIIYINIIYIGLKTTDQQYISVKISINNSKCSCKKFLFVLNV